MLTGQLIFRDTDALSRHAGQKLMMVCGVISVPKNWCFKGEHQYVVNGLASIHPPSYTEDIGIHFNTETDLTDQLKGLTLDGMIKSPIWRV